MLPYLRGAYHSLARTPRFVITVVTTLALCLGANITIFSVVDAILVRALPFPEPHRLVTLFNGYPGAGVARTTASIANYFERRAALPAFSSVSIHRDGSAIVGAEGSPRRVRIAKVSPEFFTTLGVPLALGRTFTEAELTFGTDEVAVITDGFWRSHFAAAPEVLGQTFLCNGAPVTVIGVLPPNFSYLSRKAEFYRPAAHHPQERLLAARHDNNWDMLARLGPGATLATAQTQLDTFNARWQSNEPIDQFALASGFRTTVSALHADHVRSIKPTLLLLQAGVGFLLLIGVVNLANLLLIRASGRTRDLAVRQALGAGRRHIAAATAIETLLLTLGGGFVGLFLGSLGIDLLRNLGTDRLPLGTTIAFDARVATISMVATVMIGLLLAIPVVWFNLHTRLRVGLQSETRSGTTTRAVQRLRHAFIVIQIALAFVLLSGSSLLGLSLKRVLEAPVGFSADSLLSGRLLLPWKNYTGEAAQLAFADRLLVALQAVPGVTHAAISTGLPFAEGTNNNTVVVEGAPPATDNSLHAHYLTSVSADYWRMMQIPLLRGRLLEESDSHRPARVCVVDHAFAERYWPGLNPIGRRIATADQLTEANATTVVGVVGEVKQHDLTEQSGHGAVYFPHSGHSYLYVLVHTEQPPAVLAEAVRKAVLQLDPALPIYDLRPLQTRIDDSLVARRSPAILAGFFALVALLLAAIGTYGVLAYSVEQRRREIGVRMALGAQPRQVLMQFLNLGAKLLFAGLGLGLLGAWATGHAMRHLIVDAGALNLLLLIVTASVLLGVVFLALFFPALRAARTDPLVALRAE